MINLFPKTRFLTSEDTIKYVRTVLNSNRLINDYREIGELFDDYGGNIPGNLYLEYYFYMVPNHFHFLMMNDYGEDKMYRLSFLTDDNRLLYFDDGQVYHKRIEELCQSAKNTAGAKKLNMPVLPSDMRPSKWTTKDMKVIYNRVTQIINQQNPKPVRQK